MAGWISQYIATQTSDARAAAGSFVFVFVLFTLECLLNGDRELGRIRRNVGLKALDNFAFAIHQKLREIPANGSARGRIGLLIRQELIKRRHVLAGQRQLREHRKRDFVLAVGELLDGIVVRWFFLAEIIARETRESPAPGLCISHTTPPGLGIAA